MPLVVGVDAGASTTVAVAANGDAPPRTFEGDPANVRIAGIDEAAYRIVRAVRAVTGDATPDALFVGAAGIGRNDLAQALTAALERRLPDVRIGVSDDAHIALRAGVEDGDGLVLIAGTGSIAYAEIAGERYRVGGHGYLLGDEGSGFAIGSAAVRLLLRSYDGRVPRDPFLDAVEERMEVASAFDVIAAVYDRPHPVTTLASLAPIVLEHAGMGERSATKIVQTAALDLFELVKALVRTAGIEKQPLPLVFAGGLLRANSLLTYLFETRLAHDFPFLEPLKGAPLPHFGALAQARALLA